MSIFRRQKKRFTSILITFLMALQMSACTSEDNLAATENTISDITTDTDTISDITTDTDTNTNHAAIITGDERDNVTEDVAPGGNNLLQVSGTLSITDGDAGEAAFIAGTITGSYGSLTIDAAGNWRYATDNNQVVIQNLATNATLTDNLVVSSVDGTTHSMVITINGVDEPNTIILSWIAPAEREDNSALSLSAIAGYKIYYGATQGQYSDNITINDGTAVDYTFTGLPGDTYYFVVTTVDTEGRESQYSSEVTITI